MLAMTFDTLKHVNRLKAAQVSDEQAQAQVRALQEALVQANEQTVTQIQVQTDSQFALLRKDMELMCKEINQEMELLHKDIIIKLGTMIAASAGIMAAVVKLF